MKNYLNDYSNSIIKALTEIDENAFQEAIRILGEAYKKRKHIFIAGNGGSAGTANHFVCDFGKNAVKSEDKRCEPHTTYATLRGGCFLLNSATAESINRLSP